MKGWTVVLVAVVSVIVVSRLLAGLATTDQTVNGGGCE